VKGEIWNLGSEGMVLKLVKIFLENMVDFVRHGGWSSPDLVYF